jgi:hypothetical protein
MQNYINYPKLVDEAMRDLVVKVLHEVASEGLYGDHHFYISLSTKAFGVKLSSRMREKYPEEITIVLEHQFDNLVVEKNKFSVALHFDGIRETVVVPFSAMTAFSDPSAKFAIQFIGLDQIHSSDTSQTMHVSEGVDLGEPEADASSNNIIMLDKFRNKPKK